MSARFLIAAVSKDDRFSISEDAKRSFCDAHVGSVFQEYPRNTKYISVIGNELIRRCLEQNYDFLVIMHSDVSLDLEHLASRIVECSQKYDVMGLCGCAKFSVSQSPLNWFTGSKMFVSDRWGCVTHGEDGGHVSYFSAGHPETEDHAVACIDGLCMIFTRKAMESGLSFDEKLRFDCYDTQISLDSVLNYELRLGCIVEKSLHHFSIGKSILTDNFLKDELVLRRRFGFVVPEGSRLSEIL